MPLATVVAGIGPAGASLEIVGSLVTGGGLPVVGEAIDFVVTSPGVVIHQAAATDATGRAVVYVTVPPGQYNVTATFAGSQTYGASIGTATLLATVATATFDSLTVNGGFVGDRLQLATALVRISAPSAAIEGAPVTFTSTDPHGATSIASTTTGVAGQASASFATATRGIYQLAAQFAGDVYVAPVTSIVVAHAVYEKTLLLVNAAHGEMGHPTDVTARLVTLTNSAPLEGKPVTFDFGGVVPTATALTDGAGIAHVVVTVPSAGTYRFSASFANLADFYVDQDGDQVATTATAMLDIAAPPACPPGTGLDPNHFACNACPGGTASNGDGVCVACADGTNQAQTACREATRMVVAGAGGFAGAQVRLQATVSTAAGVPVAGQQVSFAVQSLGVYLDAVTDANGVAATTIVVPVAQSFFYTASFAGTDLLAASSGTAQLNLMKAITQFSPLAISGNFVGEGQTITTTLSRTVVPAGPVAGAPVTFLSTAPNGAVSSVVGNTHADGRVSAYLPTTQCGVYSLVTHFGGDNALSGTDSAAVSRVVYSKTQLVVPDATGQAAHATVLTATLFELPASTGLVGRSVTFSYVVNGVPTTLTSVTNAFGLAQAVVAIPVPGTYTVTASFSDFASYFVDQNGNPQPTTASAAITIVP